MGEWETKYPKIASEMASGKYKNVTEVLKAKPELKMKEFSKQYVRDALLEMGFDPAKDKAAPKLSDEQVVECAYRRSFRSSRSRARSGFAPRASSPLAWSPFWASTTNPLSHCCWSGVLVEQMRFQAQRPTSPSSQW